MSMEKDRNRFSIRFKMYIFVVLTMLFAAASVCMLSYFINVRQIDSYYKRLAINSAKNYASFADIEFLKELRTVAESEEYQALREKAEAEEDDSLIQNYLEEKGIWERYVAQRDVLRTYVSNMKDIKYLYAVAWSDTDNYDMYLIDSDNVPLYETGYYEEREKEFAGVDSSTDIPPVITNGDWGWLCSGYAAIYDEEGQLVCHIGCDIGMDDIVNERKLNMTYVLCGAAVCVVVVLIWSIIFINGAVVRPLNKLTREMEKFSPAPGRSYDEAGVVDLKIKSHDEIRNIYEEIKSMQMRITDYIDDISEISKEKKKVEEDVRSKEEVIGQISREAFKDTLTGIGNKNSYVRKVGELDRAIQNGFKDISIVMIDVNGLKCINDKYGHSEGDIYLKGVCGVICENFKHSPVYRIGGDEFVVILMGEDYRRREEKVEEITALFKESYENTELESWQRYSASVGLSDYEEGDTSIESIFKRADKKMYEEKLKFKARYGIDLESRV